MNQLKVHVQSRNTEELNYTPCGLHTTRITYHPHKVTCLVCKRKPEYRHLQDIIASGELPKIPVPEKIGLKIQFASGLIPDVSFYEGDIAGITLDGRKEFLTVVTKHGLNTYNMVHVVGIIMTATIDEDGMCSGFGI